jgi:hypothetical protein
MHRYFGCPSERRRRARHGDASRLYPAEHRAADREAADGSPPVNCRCGTIEGHTGSATSLQGPNRGWGGREKMGGPRDSTHSTYLDLRFSGLRCGSVQNPKPDRSSGGAWLPVRWRGLAGVAPGALYGLLMTSTLTAWAGGPADARRSGCAPWISSPIRRERRFRRHHLALRQPPLWRIYVEMFGIVRRQSI